MSKVTLEQQVEDLQKRVRFLEERCSQLVVAAESSNALLLASVRQAEAKEGIVLEFLEMCAWADEQAAISPRTVPRTEYELKIQAIVRQSLVESVLHNSTSSEPPEGSKLN